MPLADTLLRLAEEPRLYIPYWSDEIMQEVSRNLVAKFRKSPEQAVRREVALRTCFPSAWVDDGYRLLIPGMPNHVKDRHVLAAAVRCGSEIIVTYNQRDFPVDALEPLGITCKGPSLFLKDLYDLAPALVTAKLAEQAANIGLSLDQLLVLLRRCVPAFVDFFFDEQKNSGA
jgi:hypothetical protein